MSFLAFPPEVNSTLMYMGPGSASLMSAATAWNGLASDLASTSTGVSSAMSNLAGAWQGPTAARATGAVAPYAAWLDDTSILAGQLGAQAAAQAGLYETAHAAVVAPPLIAANRAQLLMLIATNFFGQNAPAIAATEAQYAAYWAQDGAAMDTYMAASQNNVAALPKASNPPPANTGTESQANPLAAQDAAQVNQLAASDPTNGGGGNGGTGGVPPVTDPGAGAGGAADVSSLSSAVSMASIPARFAMMPMSMLMRMLMGGSSMGAKAASGASLTGSETMMTAIGQFVDGKLGGAVGTLASHFSSATNAISAKLANAASMGGLRVPEAWSAAASGVTRAAPILPNAAVSAPAMSGSGFPGGPFGQAMMGALSGRGMGSIAAKVPKVIPRPSAGG